MCFTGSAVSGAQAAPRATLWGSFYVPIAVAPQPKSDFIWVLEKRGRVFSRNPQGQKALVLDIGGLVSFGAEQGLLGIAFHPDFNNNSLVYITYTDHRSQLVLSEYHFIQGKLKQPRIVMTIPKPFAEHNGGTMHFGKDQYLYLSTGDGGVGPRSNWKDPFGHAQNHSSLLGKILRINPMQNGISPYTIPPSNPFYKKKGWRKEIWHLGLRNPWKWNFDSRGVMWIGDVGATAYEEINRADKAGINFGWKTAEGLSRKPGLQNPFYTYSHSQADGCAIIGGLVVEDRRLANNIYNHYLFADFCQPKLRVLSYHKVKSRMVLKADPIGINIPEGLISSIDQDQAGMVYISTMNGKIWRIDP